MFFLLGRFVLRALWPFIIVAVVAILATAVLGFNPLGILKDWLITQLGGIEYWFTCEVIGWGC